MSTRSQQIQGILERREQVHALIKKCDEDRIWDNLKAKDIDPEILNYVQERLLEGWDFSQIRKQLGISRSTDKSWAKILSGLKQGYRVDGTAFLIHIGGKYKSLADKMYRQIEDAIENGVDVLVQEGKDKRIVKMKGPTKELSSYIDTYNRLNQGFIKNGKDLGAFIDNDGKGAAGGVTIVVQTNVPMPSREVIQAHQDKLRKPDIEIKAQDASKPER